MSKRVKRKSKRPRKKILLFLVEGKTDKITLSVQIEAFLDKCNIQGILPRFVMVAGGGDSTSDKELNPEMIEMEISKIIDMHDNDRGEFIYLKDVVKMVQIVDMDGAFIEDDSIIQRDEEWKRIENRTYFLDRVETDNALYTRKSFERKRRNIEHLSTIKTFHLGSHDVEYSIFFFASNLEHFLYDEQNCDDYMKKAKAQRFHDECLENEALFLRVMRDGDYVLKDKSYEESWAYIKEPGLNSLTRCSNINLLFRDLEDWGERFSMEQEVNQEGSPT